MKITKFAFLVAFWGSLGASGSWQAAAQDALPQSDNVFTEAAPLPSHPNRTSPTPQASRPRPAAPSRDQDFGPTTGLRSTSRLPIPGQPARDLEPPGEFEVSEVEAAGIFAGIPHATPNGGIVAEVIYTGETFNLARGGMDHSRRTNYRSNLDVVLNVDFEAMGIIDGGRLFIYGESLSGTLLPSGEIQLFSNIDSTISDNGRPHFTTIAEYWYEQYLMDDAMRFKLGKQDANADFAYTDLGGDFINSSFGLPPNIPLPTFPSQALGLACFLDPCDWMTLGIGVYDGTGADGPQGVRWGFDTLGHNGAITLAQIEMRGQSGPRNLHPSTIRLGAWHHSDDEQWASFETNPVQFSENYGAWASIDYLMFKESYVGDDEQGLGVFLQGSWAKADRNQLENALIGGLVYRGLLPGRDEDLLGAGVGLARLSDEFLAFERDNGTPYESREIVTELFYKYQLTPFIVLQPDLQFITAPGALFDDALLVGLRFEAVF